MTGNPPVGTCFPISGPGTLIIRVSFNKESDLSVDTYNNSLPGSRHAVTGHETWQMAKDRGAIQQPCTIFLGAGIMRTLPTCTGPGKLVGQGCIANAYGSFCAIKAALTPARCLIGLFQLTLSFIGLWTVPPCGQPCGLTHSAWITLRVTHTAHSHGYC